jgi:hypothetical protein
MMNEPGAGEHMPIDYETIDKLYVEPKDVPSNMVFVLNIDTALKSSKTIGTGDYNVISCSGYPKDGSGDVYFMGAKRSNTWQIGEFMQELSKSLWEWNKRPRKVGYITDEISPGDRIKGSSLWEENLRSSLIDAGHAHIPEIVLVPRTKGDVKVLQSFSHWRQGRVKLVRGAPNVEQLVEEAVRYGIAEHDDLIRAFTDSFTPTVYRRIKHARFGEGGEVVRLPGDEVLKGFRKPANDAEVRHIYDTLGKPVEEFEWMK